MVAIVVPQLVRLVSNLAGVELLERDCRDVCAWFARGGFVRDPERVLAEALRQVF